MRLTAQIAKNRDSQYRVCTTFNQKGIVRWNCSDSINNWCMNRLGPICLKFFGTCTSNTWWTTLQNRCIEKSLSHNSSIIKQQKKTFSKLLISHLSNPTSTHVRRHGVKPNKVNMGPFTSRVSAILTAPNQMCKTHLTSGIQIIFYCLSQ